MVARRRIELVAEMMRQEITGDQHEGGMRQRRPHLLQSGMK